MGFFANFFSGAGKLSIVFLTLYVVILALQFADNKIRENWNWYKANIPYVWWLGDIRCEMEIHHQGFGDALPPISQIVWVPIILFLTLAILKLFITV